MIELTGKRFGKWTVGEYVGQRQYKCFCVCGAEKIVFANNLTTGKSKSCGCIPMRTESAWNFTDLSGSRFGLLTVIRLHHVKDNYTYWLCQCKCGKVTIVSRRNWRQTKSCGCLRLANSLPHAARNAVLASYKAHAKKRNHQWALSDLEFDTLTQSPCHYCGIERAKVRTVSHHRIYQYNGIDRKDNHLGYTTQNTVPCCYICNKAKGDMLYEEFIAYLRRIHNHYSVLNNEHGR